MFVRTCRAIADFGLWLAHSCRPVQSSIGHPKSALKAMTSSVLPLAFCLLSCLGCRSESKCGDLWDSPTIKGTRALVVVPAGELKILRIDGRNVRPYQISKTHGQREYLIPAGEHTITAVFRYAAPVSNGLLGEVRGHPLRLKHFFHAGREYAALYRIHPYERPEPRWLCEVVAMALFTPVDYYWSMDLVDLAQTGAEIERKVQRAETAEADVGPDLRHQLAARHEDLAETVATILAQQRDIEPEVRDALLYRSFTREMDETVQQAEKKLHYQTRFRHLPNPQ